LANHRERVIRDVNLDLTRDGTLNGSNTAMSSLEPEDQAGQQCM
jgi:hypothetical protein